MHSKVVGHILKCLDGIEGQRYPGLVPVILYGEKILHLCQNIIDVLFMVEICDVIRPGTQHNQKAYEVRFGIQYFLIITEPVKAV